MNPLLYMKLWHSVAGCAFNADTVFCEVWQRQHINIIVFFFPSVFYPPEVSVLFFPLWLGLSFKRRGRGAGTLHSAQSVEHTEEE